jgi:hypothetical protein
MSIDYHVVPTQRTRITAEELINVSTQRILELQASRAPELGIVKIVNKQAVPLDGDTTLDTDSFYCFTAHGAIISSLSLCIFRYDDDTDELFELWPNTICEARNGLPKPKLDLIIDLWRATGGLSFSVRTTAGRDIGHEEIQIGIAVALSDRTYGYVMSDGDVLIPKGLWLPDEVIAEYRRRTPSVF